MLRSRWYILLLAVALMSCTCAGVPGPGAISNNSIPEATHTLWIDPRLPAAYRDQIVLPEDWEQVFQRAQASYSVEIAGDQTISNWVYVLVAPFPTITDDISVRDFLDLWHTGSSIKVALQHLVLDSQTYEILSAFLGRPAPGLIEIQSAGSILATCWAATGNWSIIPFEDLDPRWKVISLDGNSPLHKDFDPSAYTLAVHIGISSASANFSENSSVTDEISAALQITNRDPSKLSVVVVTGVTAMVRATAAMMELKGLTYPAENIVDILRSADITHISNEIAFSPTCPNPTNMGDSLVFCSKPEYIQLLEYVGTDVIEMTGDHLIDVPPEDVLYTIQMYKARGWGYYGGGENIEEARQPLLLTDHDNQIAFIGCNAKPIGYARASETEPGAVHCDWDYLDEELPLIRRNGYHPIMTFQHLEYYSYSAIPELQIDFHHAADDGAVIVSGSQGHQPQAIEFYKGAFLHYGLGNLFFDQYDEGEAQRQAFIDRHVFYDGHYINTELITILFTDYAQARLMTPDERAALLTTVFQASGWTHINP
jgi:hypothetical protein